MIQRRFGPMFIAVCVAALALRLLLPAGWMPVADAQGLRISLCSGTTLPGDPASPANDPDQPCGFALSLVPLLAATALLFAAMPLPPLPAPQPVPSVVSRRRYRPRPPGQGPPAR